VSDDEDLDKLRRQIKDLAADVAPLIQPPAPRRRGGHTAREYAAVTGEAMSSDEWCTGPEISVPLFDFWGYADCDPCSNSRSIIRARSSYTSGGLIRPWKQKTYENHPYSQNAPWIAKAIYEMKVKNVSQLVILCMCAASTQWWQDAMLLPKRNPRVIATKRLKFIGPSGKPVDSSRFEPALIYYGPNAAKFDRHFKHVAMWSTWGR
jgi:hypothetical protein